MFYAEDLRTFIICKCLVYLGIVCIICGILIISSNGSCYVQFGPSTSLRFVDVSLDTYAKYYIAITFICVIQASARVIQECGEPYLRNVVCTDNVLVVEGISKSSFQTLLRMFRTYHNIVYIIHILAVCTRLDFCITSFMAAELVSIIIDCKRLDDTLFE